MSVQTRLDRLVAGKWHSGAVLATSRAGVTRMAAAGDLDGDTPFFAASATKLVTTVLMVMLAREGRLALDAPFRSILTGEATAGLHVRGGTDRTGEITLRHLLQHCSGLPDYFQSATPKSGLLAELTRGNDRGWSFAEAMEMARPLGPVGAVGDLRRAHYSDTNFQILGQVIAEVEGESYAAVAQRRVFAPLGLLQTWIHTDPQDLRPPALRHGAAALMIPRAMASFQADGGMVTTAREGLDLLEGIFGGGLLPKDWWRGMDDWRRMFFPLRYGTGMMMFALPRVMTGFRRLPDMIGHSGLSGAVLFFAPQTGVMVAGTVNQIAHPGTVFRVMVEAVMAA